MLLIFITVYSVDEVGILRGILNFIEKDGGTTIRNGAIVSNVDVIRDAEVVFIFEEGLG